MQPCAVSTFAHVNVCSCPHSLMSTFAADPMSTLPEASRPIPTWVAPVAAGRRLEHLVRSHLASFVPCRQTHRVDRLSNIYLWLVYRVCRASVLYTALVSG